MRADYPGTLYNHASKPLTAHSPFPVPGLEAKLLQNLRSHASSIDIKQF